MSDNNNLITVTMPLSEFISMRQREKFWQDSYNNLLIIVKRYSEQGENGFYTVRDDEREELANDLEDYLNDLDE